MMNLFTQLDENTMKHSNRVGDLAAELANLLDLDTTTICQISLAATYHDIGKIKIPLSILDKPGRLTDSEYTEIKKHAVYGSDIFNR